eukprot:scaffold8995_cov139-Cylindrotheca_fusiformis.AAC.7
MQLLLILTILFSLDSHTAAFSSRESLLSPPSTVLSLTADNNGIEPRRTFLNSLALVPLALGISVAMDPAEASGGATAGGAYLLSAKQRYNERVKTSVKGLLAAADALKSGSTTEATAYFSNDDVGGYKDLTAAGYLLSNAFRRSSSTAPDSLPSVKKFKAFSKEVENFQKKLKKGADKASDEFPKVEEALETWLAEIELPASREL